MLLLQSADSALKSPERIPSSAETPLEGISMGRLKNLKSEKRDAPASKANISPPLKQVDEETLKKLEQLRAETVTGKENIPHGGSQASPRRHPKRMPLKPLQAHPVAPAVPRSARTSCRYSSKSPYPRTHGREEISKHLPSCCTLPHAWAPIHDRFIAYLSTHAPLTTDGKVSTNEESRERWSSVDMIYLLKARFPKLEIAKPMLRVSGIEDRLRWLDHHAGFDYFNMPYFAYAMEEWGHGI